MEKLIESPEEVIKNKNVFQNYKWCTSPKGRSKLVNINHLNDMHKLSKTKDNLIKENEDKYQKRENSIIDNSERYKPDMLVMTEWGIGKIANINPESQIGVVKIEGNEVEFPLSTLNTALTIYLCILCRDSTMWAEVKIGFDYTTNLLKKKICSFVKCHQSQIVLIHSGQKIDKNQNIFELGVYEKDVFLAVIKDPQELFILRTKTIKTTNKQPLFNAISFKTNQDIVLTGIGFYRNNNIDVSFDLLIYEENPVLSSSIKLVYSNKKILVKCEGAKENEIYKHKINHLEIKENVQYQIHQYLSSTDSNQNIGFKCLETVEEKNTLISFTFYNCLIQGRSNSTTVEEGMIPIIYFYIKTEN
jgi:hypothetical protein